MIRSFTKDILKEYDKKRFSAIEEQEKRIQSIYKQLPEVEELDRKIKNVGITITRALINSSEDPKKMIDNLKYQLNELKQQKAILLTENNIQLTNLEVHFKCDKCNDTGFITSGEKCACFKQELINRAYDMYNLSHILKKENFNTFNINLFSSEPLDSAISPRENMNNILNICEDFAYNPEKIDHKNLLFYGKTGLGKTFLANCIAKALLDREKIVIYQTAFKILEFLQQVRFYDSGDRQSYQLLFDADLLIIDDLGTEMTNTFTNSELFNIINSRLLSNKKILISTNLEPKDIIEIYDDRIFSRLLSKSTFKVLKFYGDDLRWEVPNIK